MNQVGRNDPCPCGSGKKYKKYEKPFYVARPDEDAVVQKLSRRLGQEGFDYILFA
jgi:hypothetical protein